MPSSGAIVDGKAETPGRERVGGTTGAHRTGITLADPPRPNARMAKMGGPIQPVDVADVPALAAVGAGVKDSDSDAEPAASWLACAMAMAVGGRDAISAAEASKAVVAAATPLTVFPVCAAKPVPHHPVPVPVPVPVVPVVCPPAVPVPAPNGPETGAVTPAALGTAAAP